MNYIFCFLPKNTSLFLLKCLLNVKKVQSAGYFGECCMRKSAVSWVDLLEMPRGTQLAAEKRSKALPHGEARQTIPSIAIQLDRSPKVVLAYLRDPKRHTSKNSRRTRRKTTIRVEKRLFRAVSNSTKCSSTLQVDLNLLISISKT